MAPGDVNKKLTFVVIFLSPFMKANWQGGFGSEIQKLMQIKIYSTSFKLSSSYFINNHNEIVEKCPYKVFEGSKNRVQKHSSVF